MSLYIGNALAIKHDLEVPKEPALAANRWQNRHRLQQYCQNERYISFRRYLPGLILFAVLVFQLTVRLTIISQSYEIESLRGVALAQDQKLRELKLQYAYITSPQRLQNLAEQKLGMQELKPQQMRMLKDSKGIEDELSKQG